MPYKEISLKLLAKAIVDNGAVMGTILLLFGFVTSLVFLVSLVDLPDTTAEAINSVSTNKYVILLIINIFLLIVGMVLDPMSANLIFSPILLMIVAPYR